MVSARARARARRISATNFDRLSGLDPTETSANRDVFESQQLERGRIERRLSKRGSRIIAVVVGVLVAVVVWFVVSLIGLGVSWALTMSDSATGSSTVGPYYTQSSRIGQGGAIEDCYQQLDKDGLAHGTCYRSVSQVPKPAWWVAASKAAAQQNAEGAATRPRPSWTREVTSVSLLKVFCTLACGLGAGVGLATVTGKRIAAANLMRQTADINQHQGDQHIMIPDEVIDHADFDLFPDAGAHTDVQASAMISHIMLEAKGLGTVEMARRAPADVRTGDGDIEILAGEILTDDQDQPQTTRMPMIDEAFGDALFDASGMPDEKTLRKRFQVARRDYNPGDRNRNRLTGFTTIGDLVRKDWNLPLYEVQRPAGAYVVDTAPVNTMVLAITRAGKGQTYIEPMIDMWSRERRPSNMVINDPKGELLVKFFVPLVRRGYSPVQFNLINSMKTDIYNPLGLAADAAREGDQTKCAQYVENIAMVFFPTDTGDDPMWNNAANNAFKRAAYGLIDYYLEEEAELRDIAARTDMDPEILEHKLDDMWGHVTLYNVYQFFVQLSSKKRKSPKTRLKEREKDQQARIKAGETIGANELITPKEREQAEQREFLWNDNEETDLLSLFFSACEALPLNGMRTLVANANNSLKAMAGAEKMLGSVYGIAITQMSFFTDPTISTLTSGKPSQNTDLGGLSFPRRFGVRLGADFVKVHHLAGAAVSWKAYDDDRFTVDLGPDFEHTDIVSREGWARYYFKGVFPHERAWLTLELSNPATGMLLRRFRFVFTKGYQLSLSGRRIVTEPVTGDRIVKDGVLRELVEAPADSPAPFVAGSSTYRQPRLQIDEIAKPQRIMDDLRIITMTTVRYTEKPRAIFLVTPPHLTKYAKLILILVKQLVDLNFDKSYMTKENQKPLYRTRFMLDELGNLQSDGHGISDFETMLSIGLGQEQQFTLILQTLQQLRDVYGDSVDRIVQGNTADIIFLKSTDDSMIEQLEKMSGKTHRTYRDSKNISQNLDQIIGGTTEGRVSYTMSTVEEPVITYNDMNTINPRNSMVFRAGDSPIWNRNETILPMSWKLFGHTISDPGHAYTLQSIPTLSSALEFDVRQNQPDFAAMVAKRMQQAVHAETARTDYQAAYDYSDSQIARLDPDVYSEEVMSLIRMLRNVENNKDPQDTEIPDDDNPLVHDDDPEAIVTDAEAEQIAQQAVARANELAVPRYADHQLSRGDLVTPDGTARLKGLDVVLVEAYRNCLTEMRRDREHFHVDGDDTLRSADGTQVWIEAGHSQRFAADAALLDRAAGTAGTRTFSQSSDAAVQMAGRSMSVRAGFYQFLASLDSWDRLADGAFERAMARQMKQS